jgi:hypothetical protein
MERAINGYYKLSWRERIGFCSGDLAQNLIYQTVSTAELAGIMARTGIPALNKMDSTVIHRRTF